MAEGGGRIALFLHWLQGELFCRGVLADWMAERLTGCQDGRTDGRTAHRRLRRTIVKEEDDAEVKRPI